MQWLTHKANASTASMVLPPFLTVILFVAMLGLAWLFGCVAKRNRQCAKSVGSIATKSMTVKNGGNTIDAVEALASWVSHCISRACGLAGGRMS